MKLEVYIRPNERPSIIMTDSNVRIFYAGTWIAFYDGEIRVRKNGECPKGGEHEWGIDGMHSNEYCKKCFIDRPDLAERKY